MKCRKEAQEALPTWHELQRRLSSHCVILEEGADMQWSAESEQELSKDIGRYTVY